MTSDWEEHFGPTPTDPAYTYRARVVYVYDGDSVTVDIDLGFGIWKFGEKLRLYGIDTKELRGPEREEGIATRNMVRNWLPSGKEILITTRKDKSGKFGRLLAMIWVPGMDVSLNEHLIATGEAKPYFGGKR